MRILLEATVVERDAAVKIKAEWIKYRLRPTLHWEWQSLNSLSQVTVFLFTVRSVKQFGFSMHHNKLASWVERQLNDNEFQTEGALMLKYLTDNTSAMQGTDSNSLFNDLKVSVGVHPSRRVDKKAAVLV